MILVRFFASGRSFGTLRDLICYLDQQKMLILKLSSGYPPLSDRPSYTHSGPVFAMFVGPGSECRVDPYKSEAIISKDEFSTLGHTIMKGRYTPNVSSNSSPKPRNCATTRVKGPRCALSEKLGSRRLAHAQTQLCGHSPGRPRPSQPGGKDGHGPLIRP